MRITNPKQYLHRLVLPLFAAAVAVGVVACENPIGDGPAGTPTGVAIFSGANKVAEYRDASGTVTGEIVVPRGETRTFRVRFTTTTGYVDVDGSDFRISNPTVIVPNVAAVSLLGPDQLRITGQLATQQPVTLTFRATHGTAAPFTAEARLRIKP